MNKELEKALDKAIKMHDDVIKTYCGMNKKYKSTAAKKAFEAVLFHAKANKRQLEQLKGADAHRVAAVAAKLMDSAFLCFEAEGALWEVYDIASGRCDK